MPKTDKQLTGGLGESYARRHLEGLGYEILEQNWRRRRTEIDLIAKEGEVLVFVEVKTRQQDYFGGPTGEVSAEQQARITAAAGVYMEQIGHDWEIRFDIIGILLQPNGDYQLEHIQDAWWPGM
ncbi:MAG: YraN family protein [Bacteroidota bacterium]